MRHPALLALAAGALLTLGASWPAGHATAAPKPAPKALDLSYCARTERMFATAYFIRTMGPFTRGGTSIWQAGPTVAVATERWAELRGYHVDLYWDGGYESSFLVDDSGYLNWSQLDIAVDTWAEAYYWSGYTYTACFY